MKIKFYLLARSSYLESYDIQKQHEIKQKTVSIILLQTEQILILLRQFSSQKCYIYVFQFQFGCQFYGYFFEQHRNVDNLKIILWLLTSLPPLSIPPFSLSSSAFSSLIYSYLSSFYLHLDHLLFLSFLLLILFVSSSSTFPSASRSSSASGPGLHCFCYGFPSLTSVMQKARERLNGISDVLLRK